MERIYLDYAASTPVHEDVLREMIPYFNEKFGNSGSLHSFGQEAIAVLDKAREVASNALGADFEEIIFTSSATEANNLALRGIVKNYELGIRNKELRNDNRIHNSNPRAGGLNPRIIVSAIEHESILETARDLERDGVEVIYLPVDKNGTIDLKKLKSSLNERTILVSVMYVNNVVGTIQPIAEISKIIEEFKKGNTKYKIQNTIYPLFHVDAVQAFQYLDCDVNKLGVDFLTLSSHKIYGPKGAGLLYIRSLKPKAYSLKPTVTGGGQEFGLRSGTPNVPSIAGFGEAIKLALENRKEESERIGKLKEYFWSRLKKSYPKVILNSNKNTALHIINVYFPNYLSQELIIKLDNVGVAVSSGSACSVRSATPSYILKAMGFDNKRAGESLRFSFGKYTTKKDIEEAVKRIKKVLKNLS